MKKYVVFPTNSDSLTELLIKRAEELGYILDKHMSLCYMESVTLNTEQGTITHTRYDQNGYVSKDVLYHEDGDYRKFILTDYYEFVEPLKIGDDVVEFTEGGIKVGCTEVDKETILKIVERLND